MTYSIVASDLQAQHLGVAVQTHLSSVGAWVPWIMPGVGAIATQAQANIRFGPIGLHLLASGLTATHTLAALLASDTHPATRQVAVLAADGTTACHTGGYCTPFAGHITAQGYSVQANMMLRDEVPSAMAHAFTTTTGSLVRRLLHSLEAAEDAGGDVRGLNRLP
ncbi:MAG: DUF1028 domain-containing protein [Blastochloris sp.]|nr:DUF1028 domain-containing protein [Blastochloris sp.]